MTRRLLATLIMTAVVFGLSARAADTPQPKKPADVTKKKDDGDKLTPEQIEAAQKEAAQKQEQLKRQFDEFKQGVLRLAQRLDSSPKPEDKDKAKALREAINATGTQSIDAKFIALAAALKGSEAFKDLDQLNTLIKENKDLQSEIRLLIDLLMKDNRDAELKRLREETERMLERLKEIIAKQERHRAQVEMGRKESKDLAKGQKDLKDQTRELHDPNKKGDKSNEAKGEGKGAGKDGKDAKGEGKNDTKGPKGEAKENKESKDSKGGEGKEGKPSEGKDGEGKEGKPSDGKGGESKEGKPGEGGEGKEGKPGEGKPSEGKPADSKPTEGKPGSGKEGKPSDGKGGEGKPSDAKGEGKPGEGKGGKTGEPKSGSDSKGRGEGKGEGKGGKGGEGKPGEGKPSDGKGGGQSQPGQGQPGEGKPGEGGSGGGKSPPPPSSQPQEITQAKKKIKDGNDKQGDAQQDLEKDNKPKAVEDEDKAIKDFKDAQKKLEDLLRQLREEEAERLLAQLQARCERMRAMQIAVRDNTINIDKAIQGNMDKKPTRADAQSSNVQSDKEDEIVKESNIAIKLIETEGTAIAFAEVFRQVRSDMMNVRDRLRKTDVGVVTVAIENQIIDDLGDMIEALKKAIKQIQQGKQNPPGQSGPPPDPKLLDVLQELKLILARQKRVNARTELYGKQYPDEQAITRSLEALAPEDREKSEMLLKELKELADQQAKLGKVTGDISKGKNKAN